MTLILIVGGVSLTDMSEPSIGDEQPVEVTTNSSGSYSMVSTRRKGYSPSTER
jgi:hypothetical protein